MVENNFVHHVLSVFGFLACSLGINESVHSFPSLSLSRTHSNVLEALDILSQSTQYSNPGADQRVPKVGSVLTQYQVTANRLTRYLVVRYRPSDYLPYLGTLETLEGLTLKAAPPIRNPDEPS